MAYLLLAAAQVLGLVLMPFSSMGMWLQLGGIALFAWSTDFQPIGVVPLLVLVGLGLASEIVRVASGAIRIQPAVRVRLGIAGLAGGFAGAAAGIALPLFGSIFAAVAGAATATTVGASTLRSEGEGSPRVAASAVAMTLATATGVVVAIFTLLIIAR